MFEKFLQQKSQCGMFNSYLGTFESNKLNFVSS